MSSNRNATVDLSGIYSPSQRYRSGPDQDGWTEQPFPLGNGAEATRGFMPAMERAIQAERARRGLEPVEAADVSVNPGSDALPDQPDPSAAPPKPQPTL